MAVASEEACAMVAVIAAVKATTSKTTAATATAAAATTAAVTPPPKTVERNIFEYIDRKNKDYFFTTNLLFRCAIPRKNLNSPHHIFLLYRIPPLLTLRAVPYFASEFIPLLRPELAPPPVCCLHKIQVRLREFCRSDHGSRRLGLQPK
jgi:hypothetical protein